MLWTIVGILLIALGSITSSVLMWQYRGFAITALGTLLMYIGSRSDSKKESEQLKKQLTTKVDEVLDKIDTAKNNALTGSKLEAHPDSELDLVKNDFLEWASKVGVRPEQKRLEISEQSLMNTKKQLQSSVKTKEIYDYTITTLKASIAALNEKCNYSLVIDVKHIPENLISDTSKGYLGYIKFSDNYKWDLYLNTGFVSHTHTLYFSLINDNPKKHEIGFFYINKDADFIFLHVSEKIPQLPSLIHKHLLNDYVQTLKVSLLNLLEAQIITMD